MIGGFIWILGLLSAVTGEFTGCAGYINIPRGNVITLNDVRVQLFTDGSTKPVAETEVAPKSGFFHISHEKHGKISIRLVYPDGWIFDESSIDLLVDGETDRCSLNEDLTFTFLGLEYTGSIVSEGSDIGPDGVTVKLVADTGAEHTIVTGESGTFRTGTANPILPGKYRLSAVHGSFSISAPVDLELTSQTELTNLPVITGYQVTGRIEETGQPVQGVTFMLKKDDQILQSVLSDGQGQFVFNQVKAGIYQIEPEYKTEVTKFTVAPGTQSITVSTNNQNLKNAFVVTGLTVVGTVQLGNNEPVIGATVSLDGKEAAVTDQSGWFELTAVNPGKHTVHVVKKQLEFDVSVVTITSDQPVLPVIKPAKVSLCATVDDSAGKLELYNSAGEKTATSTASEHCFMVPPGSYRIKPVTTSSGVHFTPVDKVVQVNHEPVGQIEFGQFTRAFESFVSCLADCSGISAVLTSRTTGKKITLNIEQAETGSRRRLTHGALNPGVYDLKVQNENWCFGSDEPTVSTLVQIRVPIQGEADATPATIEQKSFLLQIRSDYETKIEIINGDQKSTETVKIGLNKYCVNSAGQYQIKPDSCHVFNQQAYLFDTATPHVVDLKADLHQQFIRVKVDESLPNVADMTLYVDDVKLDGHLGYSDGHLNFVINVKQDAKLNVKPDSTYLYINPSSFSKRVSFGPDGCLKPILFEALEGLFIRGSIRPAVEKVKVDITCESEPHLHKTTSSNVDGAFSLGPLDPHKEYIINPIHQNYRFVRTDNEDRYDYEAEQLANLRITVSDQITTNAVSDVRIILSGPDRFRSILTIGETGDVAFPRLEPGDYFVIFEKKEYRFTPNKIELNLTGNEHLEVTASRYQFTAYGKLASLSNKQFPNYKVEATGKTTGCIDHVQETVTDENGNFKILGLTQDCTYDIRVHPNGDYLISPDKHQINVKKSDSKDIEFTAFKVITHTRISGNVAICPTCPLRGISAHLYNVDENGRKMLPAKEIITLTEDSGTFFNFKKIEQDGKTVQVEIHSAGTNQSFDVIANTPHRHVTFSIDNRVDPIKDLDRAHGQLGAALLVLVLIVSTLVTQRERILHFFQKNQSSGDGIERGTTKTTTRRSR